MERVEKITRHHPSFFPVSVIFAAVGEVIPSLGGLLGGHNIDWWLRVAACTGSG